MSCARGSSTPLERPELDVPRQTVDLDHGWRFVLADVAAESPAFDDAGWAEVDLPHTWNALDGQDGGDNYHRGVGWYRRHFRLPAPEGRRLFLEFDGASIAADVYLNGHLVGRHLGAFARFRFDVTRLARRENLLAVRVSNADTDHVAPLRGADFTYFGGLYRGVRLLSTGALHIDLLDAGGPGVILRQPRVSHAAADIEIETRVVNDGDATDARVEAIVSDADGRIVHRSSRATGPLAPAAAVAVTHRFTLVRPRLWNGAAASGPVDPHIYRVEIRLRDGRGRLTDQLTQPLGLRFFHFDPARGFSLNGGPHRQLHGVGLHQDWADLGSATTPRQRRVNFDLIEELGADAVRLTHYQHPDDTYREADRRGLVVWTELAVINRIAPSADFAANASQQLTELIAQNRNHPSVILWGIANEPMMHKGPDPAALLRKLHELARRLDPERPTALASHLARERDVPVHPTHAIADILGFNAYYGWYYGEMGDLAPWIERQRRDHPSRAIAVSEFGAGAGVERHAADPKPHDLSEEYQALFLDRHLAVTAQAPLWGAFIWLLADFAADHRTDGIRPGINDKGLVTHDRRIRKDGFYVVQAHWGRRPVLRIASRRFRRREGETVEVAVITNLARVELRVNGAPIPGAPRIEPGGRIQRWPGVTLRLGDNQIEASAIVEGKRLLDRVAWQAVAP